MEERNIARSFRGNDTKDGAGVRLTRVFGFGDTEAFDPFLLLDFFGSDDPEEYLAGFPWHPHRGIDTVTYMLEGSVRHGDSIGNSGTIEPGDLQWMTAGSGIIHEEMPQRSPRGVHGFQLWVNLACADKMREPEYRGVLASEIPVVGVTGGEVRLLAGDFSGTRGPVSDLSRNPLYVDIRLNPKGGIELETPKDNTAFAYIYRGGLDYPCVPLMYSMGVSRPAMDARQAPTSPQAPNSVAGTCLLFRPGECIRFEAGSEGASLIFAMAKPLREPIAWGGPIVMNTREELDLAFREFEEGRFIKKKRDTASL